MSKMKTWGKHIVHTAIASDRRLQQACFTHKQNELKHNPYEITNMITQPIFPTRLAISSRKVVLLSTTPLVVVGGFWNGRNSLSCSLLVYRLVEIYEISRSRGSGVAGGWDKQILVLRIAKKNILKIILNTCNFKKRSSSRFWLYYRVYNPFLIIL